MFWTPSTLLLFSSSFKHLKTIKEQPKIIVLFCSHLNEIIFTKEDLVKENKSGHIKIIDETHREIWYFTSLSTFVHDGAKGPYDSQASNSLRRFQDKIDYGGMNQQWTPLSIQKKKKLRKYILVTILTPNILSVK